jgi:hypothetical protein
MMMPLIKNVCVSLLHVQQDRVFLCYMYSERREYLPQPVLPVFGFNSKKKNIYIENK